MDEFSPKKVAVTGSRGFIGQAVHRALKAQAYESSILTGDVRSLETFSGDFDTLLHLAGAVPPTFQMDPGLARDTNIEGTRNALAACARNGGHLVFASSCGIYDPHQPSPISENGRLNPVDAYGKSKLVGEELCRKSAAEGLCRTTILRIFNPYGPSQPPYMLMPYILSELAQGKRPKIKSPESQRDFVHVDDVARAFLLSINSRKDFAVLNIGSGKATSVREICETLIEATGSKIQALNMEGTGTQTTAVIANISEAERQIGWTPLVSLKDGLHQIANLFIPEA